METDKLNKLKESPNLFRVQNAGIQPVESYERPVPVEPVSAPVMVDADSATSGMDALRKMYTSPEEEERQRKSSLARQRIIALADAARHIGNIFNTVRYAPSQQFNNPLAMAQQRYKEEKALRDADNYRYMTYRQAEQKRQAELAQRAFENEMKVRTYGLNKAKADSQMETDKLRRRGYELDAQRKQSDLEYLPTKREIERQNVESQIKARDDASKRGWANIGLSRQRLALGWANHNTSVNRILRSDSKKDYVYAPSGATYSFPKGTFTGTKGKANLNTLYAAMMKKGLVPNEKDFEIQTQYGTQGMSDDDKLMYIMEAASTAEGHDDFVFGAKRLGYRYEGGMTPEYSNRIFRYARSRGGRPQKKATPQASVQPKKEVKKQTSNKSYNNTKALGL